MPHILVRSFLSPGLRGYTGCKTFIDYHADDGEQGEFGSLQNAMSHLGAKCIRGCDRFDYSSHSDPYCSYQTSQPPYFVLNRLEKQGYKVVAANSVAESGTNYVLQMWTLHKQA